MTRAVTNMQDIKIAAAERAGLLRRQPRHQGRGRRHRRQDRHRLHRPLGLRQVDLPALPQPDERHDRHRPRRGRHPARRRGHLRQRASTRCSCAPRSAWCSRSRTRSRSRSTTTWPTAPASTAWPATRPSWTRSSRRALRRAALWNEVKDRLQAPGHRPVGRPAAAPVHRPRRRDRARGAADGRAVLGARPDRHRPGRGADRRAARRTTRS